MSLHPDVTERVQAGINWLDDHRPDWRSMIDLESLDLANPWACVLGQVAGVLGGGFSDIVSPRHAKGVHSHNGCILRLMRMSERMTGRQAVALGFEVDNHYSYRDLDEAWKVALS